MDSFNNAYRDEDILYQIYKENMFGFLFYECCISLNMHFLQSLLECSIFFIQVRKYLILIYLAVFGPMYNVKAVQDDISSKTIRL